MGKEINPCRVKLFEPPEEAFVEIEAIRHLTLAILLVLANRDIDIIDDLRSFLLSEEFARILKNIRVKHTLISPDQPRVTIENFIGAFLKDLSEGHAHTIISPPPSSR